MGKLFIIILMEKRIVLSITMMEKRMVRTFSMIRMGKYIGQETTKMKF